MQLILPSVQKWIKEKFQIKSELASFRSNLISFFDIRIFKIIYHLSYYFFHGSIKRISSFLSPYSFHKIKSYVFKKQENTLY